MLARCHATATFCLLAIAAASLLTGCESSSQSKGLTNSVERSSFTISLAAVSDSTFSNQHQFYYYPNAQVYRDCDQDRWLWSDDAGATWVSATRLPEHVMLQDEIPYAVHLTQDNPASEHQAIAAAFPATAELPVTATVQGRADID